MAGSRSRKSRAAWRAVLTLAVLVPALTAPESEARGAPQNSETQGEQAEGHVDALIEALGHALGMTPEEVAALGLSPAEMESLLAGFTEETVVVGSRAQPRSATESAVPVDVLSATDLLRRGAGDLKEQLRTVIPSFNSNTQPIQGASTVVRPAMLRNLAPDHTLVLINGKRRHRSSVLEWHGGNGVAYGSQGPDISVIPAIALRQVEVLRDGAAAQYGSDAIAGVMNFQLKDAASGGSFEVNTGMHGAGDGEAYQFAGNVGLPLGSAGFANLSLEFGNANQTDRTAPRSDAVALIAAGNTHVRSEHPQVWGNPDIDDELKLFGNFGYSLPRGVQLYAHTNYASKTVTQSFFFRNPNTRLGVFGIDGGRTLLIGDALAAAGQGSANCPTVAVTDHVPDPVALQQVFDDPNCFSFQELFPGGFTPQMGGTARDASLVGGVRGFTSAGFNWDLSGSVGVHESELFINETVNASLGPASPTSFDVGANRQRELNLHFDVTYAVTERINVAAGTEWRDEQFRTMQGDREGWLVGPYARQTFMSGANGFFAYGPQHAGSWSRHNVAAYGDLEVSGIDNDWTLGTAVRVENFEDFGTTTNGKVSGRFRFLRGSVSTGFRAPTPGQQNGFNISSWFDPTVGDLVNNAVIPSISPAAQLRGGRALAPEESVNYTLGLVYDAGQFTLTADWFLIQVSDRIGITSNFLLTDAEIADLVAGGFDAAESVRNFRFFTNAFNTRSRGVDVVTTYTPLALRGNTVISGVFSYTDTEVTDNAKGLLDGRRLAEYAHSLPRTRWNAAVTQRLGQRASLLGRLSYYGGWYDYDSGYGTVFDPSGGLEQGFFAGRPIVDLELSVDVGQGTTLSVGAQNLLNTYSQESVVAMSVGERYSEYTPWGYSGSSHYVRLGYGWGN
ncbi:MAG: TonB-dependent receptor [Acidobacteria bacterium]|nr:TonB-dependent receptor [Acidobacteriota bacterium]